MAANTQTVEQWGIFELELEGPRDGNPYLDVQLRACFRYRHRTVVAGGFYDGDGVYRIRFMPDTPGDWTYTTESNNDALDGKSGGFECSAPSSGNHGAVRVRDTYHFEYADGTPFFPIGTTCYVWNHQGNEREEQTLETLKSAPFNKIRMMVFPKHYLYNEREPDYHPFQGSLEKGWDFARFNPSFFRHLEQRIAGLLALGIEADLILFHAYDRWGYSTMSAEEDDRYLRYVVARLAAYRNVWWSLANEFDLMKAKTMADWDRFFRIVQESDPHQHLRSVHNCRVFYDHAKPWVTHQSIQHHDIINVSAWRKQYRKPLVLDECGYEGNIEKDWGNLPPQELVKRLWETVARGGYACAHAETFRKPVKWWSHGGTLHGESPKRIAFLRKVLEQGPPEGLEPIGEDLRGRAPCAGRQGRYYLTYFGIQQPSFRPLKLPEDADFAIDILDTWEMTITSAEGTYRGECQVELPGKPYIALRARRID